MAFINSPKTWKPTNFQSHYETQGTGSTKTKSFCLKKENSYLSISAAVVQYVKCLFIFSKLEVLGIRASLQFLPLLGSAQKAIIEVCVMAL